MRFSGYGRQDLLYSLIAAWLICSAYGYLFSFVYGNVPAIVAFKQAPQSRSVESAGKGPDKRLAGANCQDATGDWAFVCTRHVTNSEGVSIKQRIVVPKNPYHSEIVIPDAGPIPTSAEVNAYSFAHSRFSKQLDLNRASEDRITRLPGIDKVLARRIVLAALSQPFTTVDELLRVEGMNEKRLQAIRSRVRAGSEGEPKLEQFIGQGK